MPEVVGIVAALLVRADDPALAALDLGLAVLEVAGHLFHLDHRLPLRLLPLGAGIGEESELFGDDALAIGEFGRLALERLLERGHRLLFAGERRLALGEIGGGFGRHRRQVDGSFGIEQFGAGAIALGFDLGERGPGVLDAGIEGGGLLAQAHHLGLAAGTAIGDDLFTLGEIGRAGVELCGLFGEVALGLGPVHLGALLLAFHRGPGIAESIAGRGGGGVELGAKGGEPRELAGDPIALVGQLFLSLFEPPHLLGVAVFDPANEAGGELVRAVAIAGRLNVRFLDLDEQPFAFFPVGRELGAFGAGLARASVSDCARSSFFSRCC